MRAVTRFAPVAGGSIDRPASSSPRAQATVAGYRARSATLIRSCSDSSVSPGQYRDHLLGQDRPGVHLEGGQVHGAPGLGDARGERVAHPVPAGEGREQRRVRVQDAAREGVCTVWDNTVPKPAMATRSTWCATKVAATVAV